MELTNEFSVAAPIDVAWATLLDVERIAPCMPGAALTSFDGESFTGTVKVKLGPVSLTYAGKGRFVAKDDAAHRIVIEASGKDKRGTATAAATVTGTLHAEGDATRVHVVTDLRITGAPAQFGRGMIADVAGRLVGQFADCLASTIAAAAPAAAQAIASPAAEPSAARTVAPAAEPPAAQALAGEASPEHPAAEPAQVKAASGNAADEADTTGGASDLATGAAIVTTIAAADPGAASAISAAAKAPQKTAREVEPIDLLAVTGTAAAARRTLPYVLSFLAGAAVGALVVWLLT